MESPSIIASAVRRACSERRSLEHLRARHCVSQRRACVRLDVAAPPTIGLPTLPNNYLIATHPYDGRCEQAIDPMVKLFASLDAVARDGSDELN